MSMTKCKECGTAISTKADACPKCGARQIHTSGCAKIALGLILFTAFVAAVGQCSEGSKDSAPPADHKTSNTHPHLAKSSSTTKTKGTVISLSTKMANDSQTLDDIEDRIKDNKEFLKKYYATPDRLKQSVADAVNLALVESSYINAKDAKQKSLYKRASSLAGLVEPQTRELYASSLSQIFIKSGMDVDVSAIGHKKELLRIKYALMSKPLVYKFQNEIKIEDQARPIGFKKIIYTNGFESSLGETWTENL